MPLPSCARMYRYFQRVHVRSESGRQSGYFRSCSAYFDNGQFTVLLRHRRNPRLRRPFPLLTLDPRTKEVDIHRTTKVCSFRTNGRVEA
jgi:hypothetical protein